jgi:uncharacterized protein with GYD domain
MSITYHQQFAKRSAGHALAFLREGDMAKYLIQGSYTPDGIQGLMKEGASGRRDHFRQNVASLDGSVETLYFAFGSDDLVAIVDLPDNVSSAALSLGIGAGGAFRSRVTVLLTPEEIDEAVRKDISYRRPGA